MQAWWQWTAGEMLRALEEGRVTSVELVQALHARADEVEASVRGFTEQYREAALKRAEEADKARAAGERWGALHGLPVTIKENFALTGTPVTLGIVHRITHISEDDAVLVSLLLREGAIILGKSNVPQLLLAIETDNEIWGPTHNPWKLSRASGGSSGGEAALIASGSSPLGIGTDIGGSIRNPAAFCGICGLKPTWSRWSGRGQGGGQPGQESIHAQAGPMARTVDDLSLLMRVLSPEAQHEADPTVPPLPFPDPASIDLKRLRVGYVEDEGVLEPAASVRRAVREAADVLRAAGATVIPFQPTGSWEMVDTYFALLSADGFQTALDQLHSDPLTQPLATVGRTARLPVGVRRALSRTLKLVGEKRVARQLTLLGEKSTTSVWKLNAKRDRLKAAELAAWREAGIDLLLAPPVSTPAPLPGKTHDWSLGSWPCMRYNLLDLPAGVVPVTRVRADETKRTTLRDRLDRRAAEFEAGSEGLPVGVQVVGRPWEEHLVLAAMRAIEAGRRADPSYPVTPVDPTP